MKTLSSFIAAATLLVTSLFLAACSTSTVKNARTSGVENRQDRIDSRAEARQERWQVRGEREDARAKARFDSW